MGSVISAVKISLFLLFGWAMLLPLPPATAAEKDSTCFDFVWINAHEDPWYLDEKGQRIIPEVSREWLAVDFGVASGMSDMSDMPDFNQRYAELFDHRLEVPGTTGDKVLYRVRQGLPSGTFDALVKRLRDDRSVRFVQPVWRIDGQLHAPPEQLEVTWKTVTPPQERRQLLDTAGAAETTGAGPPDTELVRIDPCRRAPWQAAVLLAQDLRVVSAIPRLPVIEPPAAVRFEVQTTGALTGTPIPFRLEIRFSDGIRIESATLANLDLKPGGIFRNLYEVIFDQPLSGIDLSRSPITVTGHLLLYAPGETVIPAVPVYYTDSRSGNGEGHIRTVSTRVIPLRIAALVPETPGDHLLQVAPPTAPAPLTLPSLAGRRKTAVLMTVAGLILLTAAIGGWLWLNRDTVHKESTPEDLRRQQRLEDLAARIRQDPATMQVTECAAFGAALQEYLGEVAGLPPETRGGGHAFFLQKLENRLPEADLARAAILLREIDHLLTGGSIVAERVRPLLDQAQVLLDSLETRRAAGGS
jgi:hypothetical protein